MSSRDNCHSWGVFAAAEGDLVGLRSSVLLRDAAFMSNVFFIIHKAASSACKMPCLCQQAIKTFANISAVIIFKT